MSDNDKTKQDRLKAILSELLQQQLGDSLASVEESLSSWRAGEIGVFEAHAEVLKHAIRAERMAGRIAQINDESSGPILRDALDAGIIEHREFVELVGHPPEDPAGLPIKQTFVSDLLAQGPVLVHVDARVKGVSVPLHLKKDAKLVLRFGYDLKPEIPDLLVDEDGVSGTLTFSQVPHHCVLPWSAIYAAVSESDQRGMVWPDDVPEEVLALMVPPEGAHRGDMTAEPTGMEPDRPTSARRRASHLKLVD